MKWNCGSQAVMRTPPDHMSIITIIFTQDMKHIVTCQTVVGQRDEERATMKTDS